MSKKYSLNNREIGYSYCECGNYLYSDTEKRIKVAGRNQVTYYFEEKCLEINCSHCNKKYQSEIIDVWFR